MKNVPFLRGQKTVDIHTTSVYHWHMKAQYGPPASDTISTCGYMTATRLPATVRTRLGNGFATNAETIQASVTRPETGTALPILCYTFVPAILL